MVTLSVDEVLMETSYQKNNSNDAFDDDTTTSMTLLENMHREHVIQSRF